MNPIAVFVAIFAAIFIPLMLMLVLSGKRWRVMQERARARRLTDAKMNARLLRLDI